MSKTMIDVVEAMDYNTKMLLTQDQLEECTQQAERYDKTSLRTVKTVSLYSKDLKDMFCAYVVVKQTHEDSVKEVKVKWVFDFTKMMKILPEGESLYVVNGARYMMRSYRNTVLGKLTRKGFKVGQKGMFFTDDEGGMYGAHRIWNSGAQEEQG